MEMILDYHIVFMVMSFLLFLVCVVFLVEHPSREKVMFTMLLCGFNIVLTSLCFLGFFGIGVFTIQNGEFIVEIYPGMYPVFGIFWLLYWINIILLFYCWWKFMRNPLELDQSE